MLKRVAVCRTPMRDFIVAIIFHAAPDIFSFLHIAFTLMPCAAAILRRQLSRIQL
jgi:hypothetical protein